MRWKPRRQKKKCAFEDKKPLQKNNISNTYVCVHLRVAGKAEEARVEAVEQVLLVAGNDAKSSGITLEGLGQKWGEMRQGDKVEARRKTRSGIASRMEEFLLLRDVETHLGEPNIRVSGEQ